MPPAKRTEPLSDSDRMALEHARAEMEEDKHRAWLVAGIKRVAGVATAVIAFVVIVWDFALKVYKSLTP